MNLNSSSTINLNGNALRLAVSGTGNFNFPIDDGSGNPIPVAVNLTSGNAISGAYIELTTTGSKHPSNANTTNYLNRYWTVNTNGITGPNYDITVDYISSDIAGTESSIAAGLWTGSLPWQKDGAAFSNSITFAGITATSAEITGITLAPPTVEINNGNASETICNDGTSSVTLTAVPTGDPGWTYSWTPATGLTAINTSNPDASPSITTIYIVTVTDGNGFTATDDITVDVDPLSIGGSIAGAATVCSGTNSTILTLSGQTGTIQKWEYSTDSGSSWNDLSNTNDTYTASNLTQTTTYRAVVKSGVCSEATSSEVTINVDPESVGGTIAGGTTVCSGTNSTLLTLSGQTGTIQKWEYSTDSGSSWNDLSNTNDTYTASNLTQTTTYRAVVKSGVCSEATSSEVTINVDPESVGGTIAGGTTVCSGTNSTLLTLSGQTGTIQKWEYSTDSGSSWNDISNTNDTYTAFNLTQTTTYRAVVKSGSCPEATSSEVTINVDPESVGGTIAGGTTVCSGTNSSILTLSGHTGDIIRWESSTDGTNWTNITNTTTTHTAANLTQTTTYRAVVKSGTCNEAVSSETTISVDPLSNGGSIAGATTVCSGTNSSVLTLSGHTGDIIRWESSTDGTNWTNITNTTTTHTAANLIQTTTYRAVVQSGSCSEAVSIETTISVDPVSIGGSIAGASTVCSGTNSTTLTLSGQTGDVVRWESTTDGSNWTGVANTSTTYAASNLTQTTTYRAVVQSGTCSEAVSSEATISVDPVSVGGSIAGAATVCSGTNSTTLTLSGQTGDVVRWESTTDGSNWTSVANTSTTYAASNLTQTTTYRAVVQSGLCDEIYTAEVTVTVRPTPTATISGTTEVCQGESPLPVVTITNPMAWAVTVTYNIQGSGTTTLNIAANGTGTISQSTTTAGIFNYNLESVAYTSAPVCSNTVTGTATITVHPTPTVDAIADQILCNDKQFSGLTITGPEPGTTFAWTNSNPSIGLAASGNGNIPAFTTINGTSSPISGTITVTPTANECPGTPFTFNITIKPTPTVSITGTTTVCQNDASPHITFTNPLSLPVTVTYRKNSVAQTINVAANSTALVTVPTNTAGIFTYELVSVEFQSEPTCSYGASGTATVTVTPRANAVPTPASQSICSDGTINTIVLTQQYFGSNF